MNSILLFVPDLFFATKVEDVAKRLGLEPISIGPKSDVQLTVSQHQPKLALVAFDRTGDDWQTLASAITRAGVPVVAFGSHMNVDAFKRAKELGCVEAVANSRLSAELPNLLSKWAGLPKP